MKFEKPSAIVVRLSSNAAVFTTSDVAPSECSSECKKVCKGNCKWHCAYYEVCDYEECNDY